MLHGFGKIVDLPWVRSAFGNVSFIALSLYLIFISLWQRNDAGHFLEILLRFSDKVIFDALRPAVPRFAELIIGKSRFLEIIAFCYYEFRSVEKNMNEDMFEPVKR